MRCADHASGKLGGPGILLILMVGMSLPGMGCLSPRQGADGTGTAGSESLAELWGIEMTAVRLSANGNMVDVRYRVLDPDKAAELSDPASKPSLIDQASGVTLLVPRTPKIGPLRQTAQRPEAGRVYFMLFSNPGKVVKAGSLVTVVVGNFRAENLVVQ